MLIKKIYETDGLDFYSASALSEMNLPYYAGGISAGFPSPAEDHMEVTIDLNKELIKHPAATFYARVKGESMKDAGIDNGDLLVIDKSLKPADGKIAVCFLDGEFVIKKIKIEKDLCRLLPANDRYKPVTVTAENEFVIWGIVTHVIKTC